jgi:hypothetical protein
MIMLNWRFALMVLGAYSAMVMLLPPALSGAVAETFHVDLAGDDAASGARGAPVATIQRALHLAMPGDQIELAPGRYFQDFKSVRDGQPGQPIIIRGSHGAIVSGGGSSRVVEINHDYIELRDFTIDGKHAQADGKDSYRDKLIYVVGTRPGDGVTGLRILGMKLKNAGGECIRLRYQAQRNEIARSSIETCGVYDFVYGGGGKNGEGIYIGTAPEQLGKWGAPDAAIDHSNENWVHHNTFNTRGNECVDVKEGSSGNIIEHNRCTGQKDKNSAGLDSRGSANVFRHNIVFGNRGAGVRLGGDAETDGIKNNVYSNTLRDNEAGSISVQRGPQGRICGNILSGKRTSAVGRFGGDIDPRRPC